MVRQFFTVALTLSTFAAAPADDVFPAGTTARVTMQSEADQLVLARFLKHANGAVARLTPEAVAKIEQVEDDVDRLAHDPAMRMGTCDRRDDVELDERLASQSTQSRSVDTSHLSSPHFRENEAILLLSLLLDRQGTVNILDMLPMIRSWTRSCAG